MALEAVVREAVITDIENMPLVDISLRVYTRENNSTLQILHNEGIVCNKDIEQALEKAVLRQARQDFVLATNEGVYAEDVASSECLAYALKKRTFAPEEQKKLAFRPGETLETFQKKYGHTNLLVTLRTNLLYPAPFNEPSEEHKGYLDIREPCLCS